jgi:hypothetical protein
MLALVRLLAVDAARPRHQAAIAHREEAVPPPVGRFAFAPSDAFEPALALRPGYGGESEREDAEPDQATDETASWSTETVAPPWQTDLRLPPSGPARTPRPPTNPHRHSPSIPKRYPSTA